MIKLALFADMRVLTDEGGLSAALGRIPNRYLPEMFFLYNYERGKDSFADRLIREKGIRICTPSRTEGVNTGMIIDCVRLTESKSATDAVMFITPEGNLDALFSYLYEKAKLVLWNHDSEWINEYIRLDESKDFLTDDVYRHLKDNEGIKEIKPPAPKAAVYNLEYELSKMGELTSDGDEELLKMELIEKRVRNNIVDKELIAKLDSILN